MEEEALVLGLGILALTIGSVVVLNIIIEPLLPQWLGGESSVYKMTQYR